MCCSLLTTVSTSLYLPVCIESDSLNELAIAGSWETLMPELMNQSALNAESDTMRLMWLSFSTSLLELMFRS